jgi:hypothetical protein
MTIFDPLAGPPENPGFRGPGPQFSGFRGSRLGTRKSRKCRRGKSPRDPEKSKKSEKSASPIAPYGVSGPRNSTLFFENFLKKKKKKRVFFANPGRTMGFRTPKQAYALPSDGGHVQTPGRSYEAFWDIVLQKGPLTSGHPLFSENRRVYSPPRGDGSRNYRQGL